MIPSQPSSAIGFHNAREKPSASRLSRSARIRLSDELSRTNAAAESFRSCCSSVSENCMRRSLEGAAPSAPCLRSAAGGLITAPTERRPPTSRSVRQAEHALGDDVELDLGRAALDRVGARAQPFARELELLAAEPIAFPAEPLRPEDRDLELAPAFVQLRAVVLEDRGFRTRCVARLGGVARAGERPVEAALVHLVLCETIAHDRVGDAAVALADVAARQLDGAAF